MNALLSSSFFGSIRVNGHSHSHSQLRWFFFEALLPWQLLGMHVKHISCSDLKPISKDFVMANFSNIEHWHPSMREQLEGANCSIHADAAELGFHCGHDFDPDLAICGTPCQPFSRQRLKRSAPPNQHKGYSATMEYLVPWLQSFEPKACCAEQVEGFSLREDGSVQDGSAAPLDKCLWQSVFGLGLTVFCNKVPVHCVA